MDAEDRVELDRGAVLEAAAKKEEQRRSEEARILKIATGTVAMLHKFNLCLDLTPGKLANFLVGCHF